MQTFYDPQKVRTEDKHIEEVSPTGDDRPGFGEFANVPGGIHRRPPTEAQKRARTENKHIDEPSARTMQTKAPSDTLPTSRLVSNNRCSELTEMFSPAQLASAERPRGERGQLQVPTSPVDASLHVQSSAGTGLTRSDRAALLPLLHRLDLLLDIRDLLGDSDVDLQRTLVASMTESGAPAMCPMPPNEVLALLSAETQSSQFEEEYVVGLSESLKEKVVKEGGVEENLHLHEEEEECLQRALFASITEGGVQPERPKSGGIAAKIAARKKAEAAAAAKEAEALEIAHMATEKRIIAANKKREREAAEAWKARRPPRSGYIAAKIAARKKAEREAAEAEEVEIARMAAEKRIIAASKKRERDAASAEARMEAEKRSRYLASKIAARKKRELEAAEAEVAEQARIMAARSGQLENAQVIVYGVPAAEATSVRAHPATLLVPVIPPAPEVASAPSEHELGLCDQVHHSAQQRVLTENKRSEELSPYFSLGGWVV